MVSDLVMACSSSNTNVTCMVREACQPLLDVVSTIQPSSRRCQNWYHKVPFEPHILQHAAGKHVSLLPDTLTENLCRRHSPDRLAG